MLLPIVMMLSAAPVCTTTTTCTDTCVCPPAPVKKAVKKKKPVPVVKVEPKAEPKVEPAPMVAEPKPRKGWEPGWFGIGVRGAAGLTTCDPYLFGLLGIRLKSEKLHLGVDLSTQFAYGFGASLLVYPVIDETWSWHLNAGVLAFGARTFANGSVPRTWDLTLGTGVEYRLPIKWLSLTADYRYAVANPWAMAAEVPNGLNRNAAWGNALLRSQLMFGILAHSW